MPHRGLKNRIALIVAVLLLLSALLTDAITMVFMKNLSVRREIAQKTLLLEFIGRDLEIESGLRDPGSESPVDKSIFGKSGFRSALVVTGSQETVFPLEGRADLRALRDAAQQAIQKRKAIQATLFEERGFLAIHPQIAVIGSPMGGDKNGAIAALIPLAPIYKQIDDLNKPILLYIAVNTAILGFIGLYRIFKIYLRPIDRIIRQADDYREPEDLFFAFRKEDNELNRLSTALNRMLRRIDQDRQKLKETVTSLEEANRELLQARNEVIRAEKLASVGRLAAGIAHEIGNPIGIVTGYLELLHQPDLTEVERGDFLQRTEEEVRRIDKIIRQLLDLARPKAGEPGTIAVGNLIDQTIEVLRVQPIMREIEIERSFGAEVDAVYGNSDQLRQVLLNLTLNAADAIKGADRSGGRIIWSTAGESDGLDGGKRWLVVECSDNGIGIANERIDDIFDPFYTTKEPGKGTGLGLAVSYMIVEKMGGTISVRNNPEAGATFALRLPLIS